MTNAVEKMQKPTDEEIFKAFAGSNLYRRWQEQQPGYDVQETIRGLLHEASDALLRLELYTRDKALTDQQMHKLDVIATRIASIQALAGTAA